MIKTVASALMLILTLIVWSGTEAGPDDFVKVSGSMFTVDGKPFFITGVNNHYMTFGTEVEVRRVLDDSVTLGATVIRTYLQPVIGSLDNVFLRFWTGKNRL